MAYSAHFCGCAKSSSTFFCVSIRHKVIEDVIAIDAGLRMVAVKDTHRDLLDPFDSGLEKLKRDGTYDKLVKKWKVSFSD